MAEAKKKTMNYAFTVYPKEGDLAKFEALVDKEKVKHLLLCEETCPTTGRLHWQSCIQWQDQRTASATHKLAPWSNYTPCYKLYEDNVHYCLKGDQSKDEYDSLHDKGPNYGKDLKIIFEHGNRPVSKKKQGENEKQRCKRNMDLLMDGKVDEMDIDVVAKRLKDYQYGADALLAVRNKPVRLPGVAAQYFQWHQGEPGTGKSRLITQIHPPPFIWQAETGWNGYNYEKVVVFTDVDATSCPTAYQMKTWADLDPFRVRILYGVRHIRPTCFIFTSNDTVEEVYPHMRDIHLRAMKRRMQRFHWTEPYYKDADELAGVLNPAHIPPTLAKIYDKHGASQKESLQEEESCGQAEVQWPQEDPTP